MLNETSDINKIGSSKIKKDGIIIRAILVVLLLVMGLLAYKWIDGFDFRNETIQMSISVFFVFYGAVLLLCILYEIKKGLDRSKIVNEEVSLNLKRIENYVQIEKNELLELKRTKTKILLELGRCQSKKERIGSEINNFEKNGHTKKRKLKKELRIKKKDYKMISETYREFQDELNAIKSAIKDLSQDGN